MKKLVLKVEIDDNGMAKVDRDSKGMTLLEIVGFLEFEKNYYIDLQRKNMEHMEDEVKTEILDDEPSV